MTGTLPATLAIAGRQVPVVVKRSRACRRIRLTADASAGVVRLSLPARGGLVEALRLLDANRAWLDRQVAAWPQPLPYAPGATIPFDGGALTIDWAATHPRPPTRQDDRLVVGGPLSSLPGRVERWLKAAALADMTATTLALAAEVARPVASVRIGDTRSRWGSCIGGRSATGGRIAYCWRLILAPAWVRRNVVAHEVAHLVHGHHGPAFHALLAELDPNDGKATRWLRAHGRALHWVGRTGP